MAILPNNSTGATLAIVGESVLGHQTLMRRGPQMFGRRRRSNRVADSAIQISTPAGAAVLVELDPARITDDHDTSYADVVVRAAPAACRLERTSHHAMPPGDCRVSGRNGQAAVDARYHGIGRHS